MATVARGSGRLNWAGYLLGFGLGGFFDGILLHQILQWHHLLSLVEGVGDVRNQVLFDGLFHALMYVIAAIGLVMLARSRGELGEPGAARRLFGTVLIGFGVWHVADSVLSHWLLGIHRIKLDSPNPLVWDLIWFVLFALAPIAIGVLLKRGGGRRLSGGHAAAAAIVAAVLGGGFWAGQSPADARSAVAVFRPGLSDGQIYNAIREADGYVTWKSRGIWAVEWREPGQASRLYGRGALLVSDSFLAAGCLAWARI